MNKCDTTILKISTKYINSLGINGRELKIEFKKLSKLEEIRRNRKQAVSQSMETLRLDTTKDASLKNQLSILKCQKSIFMNSCI